MPMLAKKMCIEANCTRYAEPGGSRCKEHAARAAAGYRHSEQRIERASLYNTKQWRDIRRAVLDRQPFCVECLKAGRYEIAVVVDHIKPHKGDVNLFCRMSNLQPLCKPCHDVKTATEDGGFGRSARG